MMYQKEMDRFFKENKNTSKVPTPAAMAHFYLSLETAPESAVKVQEAMNQVIFECQPEKKTETEAKRTEIEALTSCEQIIRLMRQQVAPLDQLAFINKAMEFEEEIVPLLIQKLRISLNAGFVEVAIRILMKSRLCTADELISIYDQIRMPYAQSMVMVLLGFKADEAQIPWFMEKYQQMKRLYPDEAYCEGAYYALSEMDGRFYSDEERRVE